MDADSRLPIVCCCIISNLQAALCVDVTTLCLQVPLSGPPASCILSLKRDTSLPTALRTAECARQRLQGSGTIVGAVTFLGLLPHRRMWPLP